METNKKRRFPKGIKLVMLMMMALVLQGCDWEDLRPDLKAQFRSNVCATGTEILEDQITFDYDACEFRAPYTPGVIGQPGIAPFTLGNVSFQPRVNGNASAFTPAYISHPGVVGDSYWISTAILVQINVWFFGNLSDSDVIWCDGESYSYTVPQPPQEILSCCEFSLTAPETLANGQETFTWTPAQNAARYELRIFSGDTLLTSQSVNAPTTTLTFDISQATIGGDNSLTIELVAHHTNGNTCTTDRITRNREAPPVQPAPPPPSVPTGMDCSALRVTAPTALANTNTPIYWDGVDGAVRYDVRINNSGTQLFSGSVNAPTTTLTTNTSQGTIGGNDGVPFYVDVIAVDANGETCTATREMVRDLNANGPQQPPADPPPADNSGGGGDPVGGCVDC